MLRDSAKRVGRRLLQPLTARLDTVLARLDDLDGRLARLEHEIVGPVLARLDDLDGRLARLEHEIVGPGSQAPESLRAQLGRLRDDVWHSKVANVGDRLLVGSRHLGMVFLVESDDRLIGPRFVVDGEYEPETSAFMLATVQPDSVCIDVGANFGYFTCLMSRLAWLGRTYSFEPDPHVHALLRENIAINWCEGGVTTANAAVGERAGELTLFRRMGRSGNTSIVESTEEELAVWAEAPSERFTVPCVSLDDVSADLDRVDLVKIDVEGAESLVVGGMGEMVRRHRPTIVMEWSPWQTERAGFSIEGLVDSLRSLALVPHTLGPGGSTTPITFDEVAALSYQNLVLRPA